MVAKEHDQGLAHDLGRGWPLTEAIADLDGVYLLIETAHLVPNRLKQAFGCTFLSCVSIDELRTRLPRGLFVLVRDVLCNGLRCHLLLRSLLLLLLLLLTLGLTHAPLHGRNLVNALTGFVTITSHHEPSRFT